MCFMNFCYESKFCLITALEGTRGYLTHCLKGGSKIVYKVIVNFRSSYLKENLICFFYLATIQIMLNYHHL